MPQSLQVKLLRALQERKVRPVGGDREVDFDARLVTATSRDLELEVAEHRFREDLYYRINVMRVDVNAAAGARHRHLAHRRTLRREFCSTHEEAGHRYHAPRR